MALSIFDSGNVFGRDPFFTSLVPSSSKELAAFKPRVDISENDDDYKITASLPGAKKEDICVDWHDGRLTLSGEVKHSSENVDKDRHFHSIERSYGKYERTFALPNGNVACEKIEANFADGVLHVVIPKKKKPEGSKLKVSVK